jgi:hypothetical protein
MIMFLTAKMKRKANLLSETKRNFGSFRFEAKNLKRNEAKTSEKIGP